MITVSPLETFCPTLASTLNTLPAAPASTLIPPAAPAAFGAAAGAFGAGAAFLGAAAAAAGVAAQWLQRQHVENLCSNRQPHRRRLVFILYFCFRRSVYSLSPLPQP